MICTCIAILYMYSVNVISLDHFSFVFMFFFVWWSALTSSSFSVIRGERCRNCFPIIPFPYNSNTLVYNHHITHTPDNIIAMYMITLLTTDPINVGLFVIDIIWVVFRAWYHLAAASRSCVT